MPDLHRRVPCAWCSGRLSRAVMFGVRCGPCVELCCTLCLTFTEGCCAPGAWNDCSGHELPGPCFFFCRLNVFHRLYMTRVCTAFSWSTLCMLPRVQVFRLPRPSFAFAMMLQYTFLGTSNWDIAASLQRSHYYYSYSTSASSLQCSVHV